MKRTRPMQESLINDEAVPPIDAKMPICIQPTAARLSKSQRTFNRLTAALTKAREALALWTEYLPGLQQRVIAELFPLEDEVSAVQRRLVERFDSLLTSSAKDARLSKRHRAAVVRHLLRVIEELLQQGPDPSLEAIYERHSAVSVAEMREEELGEVEAVLSTILGEEALRGHGAGNVEELFAHARAKAEALDAERATKEAGRKAKRRKGPTKAEEAAVRREQDRIEANRSVRDIFRKLASALHPDREPDDAERRRKTLLMQRANQAYERNDLLALLEIQLETEQISADHLSGLPEERLHHYNVVIGEQLKTLEAQMEEMLFPIGMELGLMLRRDSRPSVVDAAFDERIKEIRELRDAIESDLLALDDPRSRRTLLDDLIELQWDDLNSWDEMATLGAFDDVFDAEPFTPKKGKRGKRKKHA